MACAPGAIAFFAVAVTFNWLSARLKCQMKHFKRNNNAVPEDTILACTSAAVQCEPDDSK